MLDETLRPDIIETRLIPWTGLGASLKVALKLENEQVTGSFKARDNQLWQVVYSKAGIPEGFSMEGYRESLLHENESAPVVGF